MVTWYYSTERYLTPRFWLHIAGQKLASDSTFPMHALHKTRRERHDSAMSHSSAPARACSKAETRNFRTASVVLTSMRCADSSTRSAKRTVQCNVSKHNTPISSEALRFEKYCFTAREKATCGCRIDNEMEE